MNVLCQDNNNNNNNNICLKSNIQTSSVDYAGWGKTGVNSGMYMYMHIYVYVYVQLQSAKLKL